MPFFWNLILPKLDQIRNRVYLVSKLLNLCCGSNTEADKQWSTQLASIQDKQVSNQFQEGKKDLQYDLQYHRENINLVNYHFHLSSLMIANQISETGMF
jgi:hypothetical protein